MLSGRLTPNLLVVRIMGLHAQAKLPNRNRRSLGRNFGKSSRDLSRMPKPLFDFDLKSVSQVHYITGKAAINFPHAGSTTGGWHFLSYFDRESGVAKVSLAGIHYPDTTDFFGDAGVLDVTQQLIERGWAIAEKRLFMADHYRATCDMLMKWVLSESTHCNVEIDEWFPSLSEKRRLLELLVAAKPELSKVGRLHKLEAWLSSR